MLISHRLIVQSLVGVTALGAVAAVGVYGIRGIETKFDRLAAETLPALAVLRTVQAHEQRALASMVALSQSPDESRADELQAIARTELEALRRAADEIDRAGSEPIGVLDTALGDIAAAVRQRLRGRTGFELAAADAREALARTAQEVELIGGGVQRIGAAANETARQARGQVAGLIAEQRSSQRSGPLLGELTLLVHATDALQSRSGIAPLQERQRTALDTLRRLDEQAASMPSLPELLPDTALLDRGFNDPLTGLFATRTAVLAERSGAERAYRDARSSVIDAIAAARAGTGALVDELELRIEERRGTIDEALAVSGDPAGITATNVRLLLGGRALAVDLERLLGASDPALVDRRHAALEARFDGLGPLARQLGRDLDAVGHTELGRSAARAAAQLDTLGALFTRVADGLKEEFANARRLAMMLDSLVRVAEQQRSAGQRRSDALTVDVDVASRQVDEQVRNASALIGTLAAAAAGMLLLIGLLITRSIVHRLRQAVEVAESVSSGVLEPVPAVASRDELSRLLAAMGAMVGMLDGSVRQVRRATREVGNGASEITQGNVELSARTDRQAVQLSETAESTASINEAIARNAELSSQASDLVRTASEVAGRGRDVVREAIDSITKVQQGAKQISSITEVIDSIAFQTNILALNAAVEASRAGESGRGFSVVAAEVRLLAQKSKESAQQISAIINDNVRDVEHSSSLVRQAGRHIDDVAGNVDAVTQMIQTVSSSGRVQAEAVGGVDRSIGELRRTTGDNAALSEQLRQAAVSMLEQSRSLDASVSVFRLSEGAQHGQRRG